MAHSRQCSYQGKEYTILVRDPDRLHELKCPICLELVHEAKQTSCGHLFCAGCIKARECPVCRVSCGITTDNRVIREIRNLQVQCLNSERGCEWQGDLGECEDHMTNRCQFEVISCPLECEVKMERRKKDHHTNQECKLRPFTCSYCGQEETFDVITTSHYTSCSSFLLPCPAECRNTLKRDEMEHHLATCEEELVACKYAQIGCDSVVKRRNSDDHFQTEKDGHLEKAMNSVSTLTMVVSTMSLGGPVEPPFRHWLSSKPSWYPLPPCIIKMDNFKNMKEENTIWYSAPFYSHFGGYKMCLCVYANGSGDGKGTHVSVYICLMRGENDNNLKWPFRGRIKITLLNQLQPNNHLSDTTNFTKDTPKICCEQVMEGAGSGQGCGPDKLISHDGLSANAEKKICYLKGDTLYFKIESIDVELEDCNTGTPPTYSFFYNWLLGIYKLKNII